MSAPPTATLRMLETLLPQQLKDILNFIEEDNTIILREWFNQTQCLHAYIAERAVRQIWAADDKMAYFQASVESYEPSIIVDFLESFKSPQDMLDVLGRHGEEIEQERMYIRWFVADLSEHAEAKKVGVMPGDEDKAREREEEDED